MQPCATAGSISSMGTSDVILSVSPAGSARPRRGRSPAPRRLELLEPRFPHCRGTGRPRGRAAAASAAPRAAPRTSRRRRPWQIGDGFRDGLRKASRASSRGSRAAMTRPVRQPAGMSFIEWTARSIAPASSASSISLVNRPLPPISASGRSRTRSPVVVMTTISTVAVGEPMRGLQAARAFHAPDRAPGGASVPILIFGICKSCSGGC